MESLKNKIIGSWNLCRFDIEDLNGLKKPWGKNAHGLLIYSPEGFMSVSINRDPVEGVGESEHKIIFDSILFYSGSYEIEGQLITHEVTQASSPSRINKKMLRYFEFKEGILVLTTPQESFGRAILQWKRVQS